MKLKGIKNLMFGISAILLLNGCSLYEPTTEEYDIQVEVDDELEKMKEAEDNYKAEITEKMYNELDKHSNESNNYSKILSDEEIKRIEKKISHECSYEVITDKSKLVDLIIENSEDENSIFDTEYSDLVSNALSDEFDKLDENTDLEDYHNFNTLKIKTDNTIVDVTCYVLGENTIYINTDMIESNEDFINNLKYFLNCIREYPCECNNQNIRGVNYNNNIGTVLNVMASCKDTEGEYLKFPVRFAYENGKEILLLSLFSKTNPDDFYNAVYNNDFEKINKIFSLENENDKLNFYEILYSIDMKSDPGYIIGLDNHNTAINNKYKINLFRMYLKKLLKYSVGNNLSLEEHLLLFDYGKYVIVDDYLMKDVEEDFDFYLDFMKIEKEYKCYLTDYYDVDLSNIGSKENELLDTYMAINTILYKGIDNVVYNDEVINKANKYITKYPNLRLLLGYSYHTNLRYEYVKNNMKDYYDDIGEILYTEEKQKVLA